MFQGVELIDHASPLGAHFTRSLEGMGKFRVADGGRFHSAAAYDFFDLCSVWFSTTQCFCIVYTHKCNFLHGLYFIVVFDSGFLVP